MKNLTINKKSIIYGFLFGAIIAPILSSLGLISIFFENIRPVLIGPMDLVFKLIPSLQTGPNSFEIPIYKWLLGLGANGLIYALVFGFGLILIQSIFRNKTPDSNVEDNSRLN